MVRARADILPPRCFSPRAACEIVAGARASRAQFRADRRRRRRNVISRVFSNLNVLVPVFTTFAGVASVVPVPALRERAISHHALARAPRAGGLGRADAQAAALSSFPQRSPAPMCFNSPSGFKRCARAPVFPDIARARRARTPGPVPASRGFPCRLTPPALSPPASHREQRRERAREGPEEERAEQIERR